MCYSGKCNYESQDGECKCNGKAVPEDAYCMSHEHEINQLEFLKDNCKTIPEAFINPFNNLSVLVHQNALAKGFWEAERNKGELIALVHSELSEALEAIRHGNKPDDKIPAFSGLEAELADTVIRIMDMAIGLNLRLGEAIVAKMEYNLGRGYKHGKAF